MRLGLDDENGALPVVVEAGALAFTAATIYRIHICPANICPATGAGARNPDTDSVQENQSPGGERRAVRIWAIRSASPREALTSVSNHWRVKDDVRFGSLADITIRSPYVGFTPDSGDLSVHAGCPLSANSGNLRHHLRRSE